MIYQLLKASPAITDLVGSRIGPMGAIDDSQRPYIVFTLLSAKELLTNSGRTGVTPGQLWQVNIVADNYAAADAIAEAVRCHVNGFRGVVGPLPDAPFGRMFYPFLPVSPGRSQTRIHFACVDDERDAPEPPTAGNSAVGPCMRVLTVKATTSKG